MFNCGVYVYRIMKKIYLNDYSVRLHAHDYFHYIYVLNGKGIIRITDNEYEARERCLYMTPASCQHSISTKGKSTMETFEIKFGVSNSDVNRRLMDMPHEIRSVSNEIHYIYSDLLREILKKEVLYDNIINLKFGEFLLHVQRGLMKDKGIFGIDEESWPEYYTEEVNGIFTDTIRYIKDNIDKKIDIGLLSRQMGFNEAHFCRIFKERFNLTPGQFIDNLKVFKAKDLMLHSDLNITQIADKLGFSSIHYFSRFFKKKQGVSPNEFLKNMRSDTYKCVISYKGTSNIVVHE